jgi:hypothetical protein
VRKIEAYEDAAKIIDQLLEKRRYSWRLKSINWFDFDDVKQKIKSHIFQKWDQRDPSRPIERWLNTIITNQLINEVRNHYKNFARPCLNKCPFNGGGDSCLSCQSGIQCSECLAYLIWEKGKKRAYNVKIPLTIEDHSRELHANEDNFLDIEGISIKLHNEIEKILTIRQFKIYKMLYIDKIDENKIATILKFKTTEKNRKAGYKQIKNLKNKFIELAKKILNEKDII